MSSGSQEILTRLKALEVAMGQIHQKENTFSNGWCRLWSMRMCFLSGEWRVFCLNSIYEILAFTGNVQVTKSIEFYIISCGPQIPPLKH